MRLLLIILASLLWGVNVNAQLLYQDGGELSRYFPLSGTFPNKIAGIENCNNRDTAYPGGTYNWTLSRSFDTSYQGRASMRFQVINCYALPYVPGSPIIDDSLLVGGSRRVRSEVRIIERGNTVPGFTKEMWYSEVLYFPATGMPQDSLSDETINQWFEDGGADCLIRSMNKRMWVEVGPTSRRYDIFGAVGAPPTSSQSTAANTFAKYNFNQWYQFVFHYIWDGGSAGLCEIWRDGVKIQTINGATLHTTQYPNWKIGIYKADYTSHPGRSTAQRRTFFIDNIRMGNSSASYADMVSTGPVVNAGSDRTITLPVTTTTLNGTATDANGTITTILWTKVSGPAGGTITTPSALSTGITGLQQGVYQYQLTVTDNNGAIGSDIVQVTVIANQPPTANAGADQTITLPTNSTVLNGSGADTDGSIAAYAWTKVSGPSGGTISSPAAASTSITGMIQGVYVYRLTVTDNSGLTATDLVQITVNPAPNIPPTANAGADQTITLPTSSVTITAVGSTDADGTIVSYAWVKISGPTGGTITNAAIVTTTVTGLTAGTYVYQVTVTDNNGATSNDLMTITVNPAIPNQPPVANAGPDQILTLPVNSTQLQGSGSDADGSIVNFAWVKLIGPAATIASPGSAVTNITGLVAGTYVFQLTVTDNKGDIGTDAVQVLVNPAPNQPPVANAGADQAITLPTSTVTFFGSGTDADGSITAYSWTKVSGPAGGTITSPSNATTTITALQAGTYVFRLTVTDNSSATGSDLVQVVVSPAPNVPPTANAGADQTIVLPTNTATVNGSGSTDPDGTITAYLWTKVSGPAGGAITSSTSVSTGITGLTQGIYIYSLLVTDNNGSTGSDLITITVNPAIPPPNIPPTANAGSNQTITLPTNTATLSGTASTDPDGTIVAYAWTKTSGPAAGVITSSASVTTGLTALVQGTYVFRLKVTDNNGDTGTASVQVLVLPCVRVAPSVDAGIDQSIQLPVSSITLTGTASANNCATISSVLWSKVSGPSGGAITAPASLTTSVTGLQVGTYIYRLLVTDTNGDTASDAMQTVVIIAQNIPPVSLPGNNQSIQLPTSSTTLVGSGTDADGTIVAYLWRQVSGPASTITSPTSATTTVTGLTAGTYLYSLRVTDDRGDTASAVVQITVSAAPNLPPVANAGPNQTITLPINSIVLTGTGSYDLDGSIVSYSWSKSSGPASGTITSPNVITTAVTGLVQGTYVFRLLVTDNVGDTSTASMQLVVYPAPIIRPTADAGVDKAITLPISSTSATGSGTAPSGTITGYAWTQSSGPNTATISAPTSATTNFTGLIEGTYIMQFKVYDSNGDSATDVMQIVVSPAIVNAPPVVNIITNDTVLLFPDNTLTLSATATDPDGTIVSILWVKAHGTTDYLITNGTTLTPTISNLTAGNYTFRLIVTDNNGSTTTADIVISIIPNTPAGRKWFRDYRKVIKYQ